MSMRNVQEDKENLFNLVAKFMDFKPSVSAPLMILEDYSLDGHIHIRVDNDMISKYKGYFEPWFIFCFHQLKFTGTGSKSEEYARRIYLKNANAERTAVFNLLENVDPDRFALQPNSPILANVDLNRIKNLQNLFTNLIKTSSIGKLKIYYDAQKKLAKKNKKKDAPVLVSFVAQIIEVKQIFNKVIAKVWDSTEPTFDVKLPITQADDQMETNAFVVNHEKDFDLNQRTKGKAINVLVSGNLQTAKFNGKKPNDLVLFHNAKLYEADQTFKIEVSQVNVPLPEKAFVYFLDESSLLGRALKSKVDRISGDDFGDNLDTADRDRMPLNAQEDDNFSVVSFEPEELRNQITSISDFTMISDLPEPRNYQVRCVILDLFPIEYKTFDLIKMQCSRCGMDETVSNLFSVDPDGLRLAVQLYYLRHGKNADMQCPSCPEAGCSFSFEIILILRDTTGEEEDGDHHMFAFLEGKYAEEYLNLKPIEVVANLDDQEAVFLGKMDYLKQKFNGSTDRDCYMVLGKERDFYRIKSIKLSY